MPLHLEKHELGFKLWDKIYSRFYPSDLCAPATVSRRGVLGSTTSLVWQQICEKAGSSPFPLKALPDLRMNAAVKGIIG
ncbi:hypothetical protein BGX23_003943 [Mortierella sp. AD031]|nr:hypothetical protein BGX23_003943 [Mortierella sp. AD031]